ncbi:hypothetical protein, partial [Brucella abortus]|uniref:hypothetical protein n=1 Tax=Brucella abortus TaxID=235 RepID=UPI0031FBF409
QNGRAKSVAATINIENRFSFSPHVAANKIEYTIICPPIIKVFLHINMNYFSIQDQHKENQPLPNTIVYVDHG